MDQNEYLLTSEAASSLRRELDDLKQNKRPELAKRLRFAIQQGDLTENANYITAKEAQAFLEGRILEIETILRDATIIEKQDDCDEVRIGCTVVVSIDQQAQEVFHIVGMKEADPRQGKISHESPIGEALMGSRVGETSIAQTPAGEIRLEILEIR
jgi:transcription elongation factor GreA